MTTARRQPPTVPLRCRKCGSTKVRVFRQTNELRRTFRRDEAQQEHLHASVRCMNPDCKHEWWSAHETAIAVAREIDAAGVDSRVVSPPAEKKRRGAMPFYSASAGD